MTPEFPNRNYRNSILMQFLTFLDRLDQLTVLFGRMLYYTALIVIVSVGQFHRRPIPSVFTACFDIISD